MKVILILFLILFVIVSSLFLTTFISKMTGASPDMELAAEAPLEEESISIVSDNKPDTAPGLETLEEPRAEEAGFRTGDPDRDSPGGDEAGTEEAVLDLQETGGPEDKDEKTGDAGGEEPEQDTVKIYLDGDMENGIYLGAASYGTASSRAAELYGPDLADTGFSFRWKDTGLDLEPGSTHFIYIYYYHAESGWDYLRQEINITGQKPGNADIKIFIDEPNKQKPVDSLQRIRGWALDSTASGSTGISGVRVFLNGPRGFGIELGEADYGIPRSGVVDFFGRQDYLYSGYNIDLKDPGLEPGTKHTLFIYAESQSGADNYNFEKTDVFISGERQEKAVIEASVDIQALLSSDTLIIEGYAVSRDKVREFLQKQQQESSGDDAAGSSQTSGSAGSHDQDSYSVRKIVFNSNRDGNYNIYSINLDGSGVQRLTDSNSEDLYPEVSPDGKKIAYTADIGGVWQIMIMDWDGSDKRQLTNNSYRSAYPSWSHDMKYIFFEVYIDGDWEIFRINTDGSGQKRLTHNSGGHDWHPSAHPFDSKVIFESGMPGHDDIYIMNSDGSAVSRIFSRHERRRTPDMSPDSTKLTYTRYFGNNSEVYYADIRDQDEIRVTTNGDWDGHPMFSPDGKLIVYEQRSGGKEDIIIYDIQTGQKTNITNSGHKDSDGCFMYQD
jgi:Tol biopolymer transport system component